MIAGSRYAFCSGRRRPLRGVGAAHGCVQRRQPAARGGDGRSTASAIRSAPCGQRRQPSAQRRRSTLWGQRNALGSAANAKGWVLCGQRRRPSANGGDARSQRQRNALGTVRPAKAPRSQRRHRAKTLNVPGPTQHVAGSDSCNTRSRFPRRTPGLSRWFHRLTSFSTFALHAHSRRCRALPRDPGREAVASALSTPDSGGIIWTNFTLPRRS